MRADRLVATLLLLQRHQRVTAQQLATELEVSERTARRDLEALCIAGVPVYSQPGRNGGWSLLGGARTDLSGLNAAEARALFLVAGPSSNATPAVKAALRKLVRALPETLRDDADAAASAIVVDPVSWGRTRVPTPAHLDDLQQAVVDGVQVRLGYAGTNREPSVRTIHPLGLVDKGNVWYLIADTDAGMRTFRVSRVFSVERTVDAVVRPDGFALEEVWQSVAAEIDERRLSVWATLRAPASMLWPMRSLFGTGVVVGGPSGDRANPRGMIEMRVGGRSIGQIARNLAGFGGAVEVVEPREVREMLAALGADLVLAYG